MRIIYRLFPNYLEKLNISPTLWMKIKKIVGHGGLIKNFYLFLRESYDPPIWNVVADHSYIRYLLKPFLNLRRDIFLRSGGVGITLEEALWRCIGEAIERYCWYLSGIFYKNKLVFSSYSRLEKSSEVIPFDKIYLFSDSQYKKNEFPFVPLRKNDKIHWIPMFDLIRKKEFFYPAQLVFPFYPQIEKEPLFGYSTTSGISAHPKLDEAIKSSLLEQIERDAFLLTWYGKIPGTYIKISEEDMKEMFGFGLKNYPSYYLRVFEISKPPLNVPTFISILKLKSELPKLETVIGVSSHFNLEIAIRKAILESFQGIAFGKRAHLFGSFLKINLKKISNFDENFIYYLSHKKGIFNFISKKGMVSTFQEMKKRRNRQNLFYVIKKIKKYGWHLLFLDITLPEASEIGFHVIKILIPELVQLSLPSFPFFAHPRYKKVRVINRLPHPLP